MSVTMLLVEGHLDAEVLRPIFGGRPVVERRGTKYALRPIARGLRQETGQQVCYIRDRDFDFDPPSARSVPTEDSQIDNSPLGWRWCRHAIEGYLLDPSIVASALGWDAADYSRALSSAATAIRYYTAARWAIGSIRRHLPPQRDLRTEPDDCRGEFVVPGQLSEESVSSWAISHVMGYGARILQLLSETSIADQLARRKADIDDAVLGSATEILVWFSGKDLLASLNAWLADRNWTPGEFRATLRDWVIAHPEEAVAAIPEWTGLRHLVTA